MKSSQPHSVAATCLMSPPRQSRPAEYLDWPMMALSATEPESEVLSPPELVARIRERINRFGRAVRDPEPS